ncbi:type II toxin-antitoxin system antitoxin DNA ADP-ribosyl glycohydrolase DarG [Virgibacillus sp. W0181]|uniref:type II toxin-antitoxin system antitoxin DNA ADP-ribosyl glycohydrolase DarG n=1 Tax=Virgibacillus sp. W0181 TaxID=3391581 RepID=UPI003F466D19
MIKYTTGDLFQSEAEALVNTVNCEGYMGKGIAYQFKLKFPENNRDYVKAVRSGELQIGTVHSFKEDGKIIINFPTKNKWRAKSKMEYIDEGLDALIDLIRSMNIKSVAIPPLGSGNGGLIWHDVKQLMEKKLSTLQDVTIYVYEPKQNYQAKAKEEPKLSLSALIMMDIKHHLNQFNKTRLQKTAFFMDVLSNGDPYFNFKGHTFGPYDHAIAIISKNIKAFQDYHNVKSTDEAYKILYNKLISDHVESTVTELKPAINKATAFVNNIPNDDMLECVSTIAFLLKTHYELSENDIVERFQKWSDDKAKRFSEKQIREGIALLNGAGIIQQTLMGYELKPTVSIEYSK